MHQVPLYGNSEVHAAHKEWEGCQQNGQELPAHVEKAYQKAQEAVELRRAHEEAVAPGKEANADLMAAYMAYIKLEEVSCRAPTILLNILCHFKWCTWHTRAMYPFSTPLS